MVNNIQNALECLDTKGKYQKILMIFLIVVYIQLGFILLGAPFYYMNPIYKCYDQISGQHVVTPQNQACQRPQQQCYLQNDYTITAYAQLTCSNQSQRNLIQSAPYIGSIIGLLVLTPFANQKGTRKIFMLGYLLAIIGVSLNLIGAYTKFTIAMVGGQMIMGIGCYTYLILGYVIVSQFTQQKFKQKGIIILNAVWAVAQLFICVFYFWANYWSTFIIFVIVVPNIIQFIFGYFFLIESPFYYIQKQKSLENAMTGMRKIALFNGSTQQQIKNAQNFLIIALDQVNNRQRLNDNADKKQETSKFAIFKDWRFLKILFTVALLEFGLNMYYYGVQFSLGNVGLNFGYNILLTGSIESIAYFSSNFFITKIPRKKGMFVFNLICIGLGLLFFIDFQSTAVQTVLLGICRFFNTYSLSIVPMMQNQPFPYKYRAMAWGYIQGISQIGNFITPYIVTICDNNGLNPLIIISFVIMVIGTLPLLNYPQTLGKGQINLQQQQDDLKLSLRTQVQQSLIQSQDKNIQ